MDRPKTMVLVVVTVIVVVAVSVIVYYLTLPRVSLVVYPDTSVTGCGKRLNETVILHVRNDGTVDLHINATLISSYGGLENASATYTFQTDIEIPVGVEAIIAFPADGGQVVVETVSGPPGAVATGGIYAISDNPEPNPFGMWQANIFIYTRLGWIGGYGGFRIALIED